SNKINFIFFVPSLLSNFVALKTFKDYDLTCLKKVLFAGEAMPLNTLKSIKKELPDALISNLYGPTEITVDAIYWIFGQGMNDLEHVPLGIPCDNHQIIFLDEDGKIVTRANEIAEICVAGPGVALGYWNDAETTQQVFISEPGKQNSIIYKTGDLGYRYSKDGLIYMTGRRDHQFKHLGYRIEPGEIENAINQLEGIQQSCVIYDSRKKWIKAFYTADENESPPASSNLLSDLLPQHMIPHSFNQLEKFPMTPNGKINRNAIASIKK
ncbi:MAG: D-alanine--poly(phosphoribitol) ligase subunit 1, partial [Nitrospinales bacterium]